VEFPDTNEVEMTAVDLDVVADLARQLRVDSIRSSTSAGSGHPTSSMSAADLLAVLVARHLRYDWNTPDLPTNDHLIFSKGHASPLLYSVYRAVGVVSEEELLTTYRRFGARLQGHPTPVLPWVDLATGSLGLGIAAAVGVALAGKALDHLPYRTWVLCGDSETAEGSVWEALDRASYFGLDNLTVLVDVNRLGQRGPTELGWDLDTYRRRVEAFGAHAITIDGHDLAAIDAAYTEAEASDRPTVILAKTLKGKGVSFIEDKEGWHGLALSPEDAERAIAELGGTSDLTVTGIAPPPVPEGWEAAKDGAVELPIYAVGEKVATRKAFGETLAALAARPRVVVIDAEVGNSTFADLFQKVAPERYFEAFIAEQLMVAVAGGFAVRGYIPFASTFGAFFARAADFVRMLAISGLPIRLVGTHAGVEIGADGPSQMALEDLAIMRSIIGSVVLYPSDGPSAAALVEAMADAPGVAYLRATRGAYPVIYGPEQTFAIGGSAVVASSAEDTVTLIGAGVTVHAAIAAAEMLADEGVRARVIDCYSIKPLDTATIALAATETGAIVVTEDHYAEGGLGEAVATALAEGGHTPKFVHLAVRALSSSGTPEELLRAAKISAGDIADAARRVLAN
jgi:transketolase